MADPMVDLAEAWQSRPLATWAVVGVAVVGVLLVAFSSYAGCSGMRVEATEPGQPPGEAECVREFSPQVLVVAVPILLAAWGAWAGRAWALWTGIALLGVAVLMLFLSTRGALLAVLVGLLGAGAWWQATAPRRAEGDSALDVAVVVGAVAVIAIGVVGVAAEVGDFWNPCHEWGQGPGMTVIEPGDPCTTVTGSSETRAQAVARLLLVNGTPIALGGVVLWAARRDAWLPLPLCAGVLALHGLFLMAGFSLLYLAWWPVAAVWMAAGLSWRRDARTVGGEAPGLDG